MCPPSKEKENSFVIVSDYGVALRSWSQSLIIDFHCIWWLQKEPFCGLHRINYNAIGYSSSELELIQEGSIFSVEKKCTHNYTQENSNKKPRVRQQE